MAHNPVTEGEPDLSRKANLIKRSGRLYFNRAYPTDLWPVLGKSPFRLSLHTDSLRWPSGVGQMPKGAISPLPTRLGVTRKYSRQGSSVKSMLSQSRRAGSRLKTKSVLWTSPAAAARTSISIAILRL